MYGGGGSGSSGSSSSSGGSGSGGSGSGSGDDELVMVLERCQGERGCREGCVCGEVEVEVEVGEVGEV